MSNIGLELMNLNLELFGKYDGSIELRSGQYTCVYAVSTRRLRRAYLLLL